MDDLSTYEARTDWKYETLHGQFPTSASLAETILPDGRYAPHAGCTVAFRPGRLCTQVIPLMQGILSQKLGDMLAPVPPASTIHLPLRDTISPDLKRLEAIIEEVRATLGGRRITLVSDRVVHMLSESLALLLRPQTEEDYALLQEIDSRLDRIQARSYPLTPHITLAYYRPGMLDGDRVQAAIDAAQIHPESAPVFTFYSEALTVQLFQDRQHYWDIPHRICFCCDGGLNRSVLAAHILTHQAAARGLPVVGTARSAYPNTQGRPVSQQVWETLARHGIETDGTYRQARYLETEEMSWFSDFAALTEGAMERLSYLNLPAQKLHYISRFFFGVGDPEYGEITHEQAFEALYQRTEKYLESFASHYHSVQAWLGDIHPTRT